ncbi:nucleotidyltransferase [Proteiniborus sp.]|uniref:nucleotidyltransferase n=1 Tax=Proteiniborus sp. TaxID=2079015 RepID=UPI0033239254
MKIVGLITEYNPFHNGHLYHLNESKRITNSEYSVAIMSGNFLQRGEPALVDKWTRAKMAVDNGVDLVIELPIIYACQSAELFAFGAIKILDSMGCIDSVCFGSELGDIQLLNYITKILYYEPDSYVKSLKSALEQGFSYPKAIEYALINYLKESSTIDTSIISNIISNPNNILSIEYLKALNRIGSEIKPYTIKRKQSRYHDKSLTGSISSATAIREQIINNSWMENIKHTVPPITYKHLKNFYSENNDFNSLNNFSVILLYLLRNTTSEKLKNIIDVTEGLENRIISCSNNHSNIYEILNCMNTKRYTTTRLKRILIHLLINLNKDIFNNLNLHGPQYIRILGMSAKGIKIIKQAKRTSSLPIITKFADYIMLNNEILNQMIELDKKATDIYVLGLSKSQMKSNLDYFTSPYIRL